MEENKLNEELEQLRQHAESFLEAIEEIQQRDNERLAPHLAEIEENTRKNLRELEKLQAFATAKKS